MQYTSDEQILEALGPYTQSEPPNPDYDALIVAYDKARYASLNPARQALFDNYVKLELIGDEAGQKKLLDAALASDQPLIDEEIDLQYSGGGSANKSPGTVMAMRRFAYFYLTTSAYISVPGGTSPGQITNTLIPPAPYVAK